MKTLKLAFPRTESECVIRFGSGLLPEAAHTLASSFPGRKTAVVSDETVARLYGSALLEELENAGLRAELVTFPPGEASKSRRTKEFIEDRLFAKGFGRDSLLVALGGGVTGDLAGFVAATFCRGIPYVQIPTTILAMADSSVGGKTGIDVPAGKNLVGAFHQPSWVFMDCDLLRTLPEREVRAGLVEVLKHGLIKDRGLFLRFTENVSLLLDPARHGDLFADLLFQSCSIKASVVAEDEREEGLREILNFGHTVGHALELLSNWKLLHGEAVSLGIAAALRVSAECASLPPSQVAEAIETLEALGTPTRWEFRVAEALSAMKHDKKSRKGTLRFVLLNEIGSVAARGSLPVPEEAVARALLEIGGRKQ